MVPCVAFWPLDITDCNLSKIGSKNIALRFCETWNRILKACIALKQEGDEKWKPHSFMVSDQLCLRFTRKFWKMQRKWKLRIFQIYGLYDFFSPQKHEIYQKNPNFYSLYSNSLIVQSFSQFRTFSQFRIIFQTEENLIFPHKMYCIVFGW